MLRTPLYDWHRRAGARFVDFAGWEMPIQFQGVLAEHRAVRTQVGMFDISHMGRFVLRGSQVRSQLNDLVPTDVSILPPGQSLYTVLLTTEGTILDDIIIYCCSETEWILIVNGACRQQDWHWLQQHFTDIEMQDWGSSHLLVAIQGPEAISSLQSLLAVPDLRGGELASLKRFQHQQSTLGDPEATPVFVARTGYTGEDGCEVMLPQAAGVWLWQACQERGIPACGLGCRDTLRLEAAMHLYGQDMDSTTTPLEAGLGWLVHWHKTDFIGRETLVRQKKQGVSCVLVGMQIMGRDIARADYPIVCAGETVGRITSGTQSPTLGIPIALGYVPPALAKIGTLLHIQIRTKEVPAQVVKRPFYRSPRPAPR